MSSYVALSQFHCYVIFEQCWVPLIKNILWILWELWVKFQLITIKLQLHTACICVILLSNSYTDFHWEKRCYIYIYIWRLNLGCSAGNRSSSTPVGATVVSPVPTPSSCGAHESHPHCRAPGQAQIWHSASHPGLWEVFHVPHNAHLFQECPRRVPVLISCFKAAILYPECLMHGELWGKGREWSCEGALLAEWSLLLHWTWISVVCRGERYFCPSLLWVSWSFAFICRQGNTRVFSPLLINVCIFVSIATKEP